MYLSKQEWLNVEMQNNETENHLLNLAYNILMSNVYEPEGYPWSPYRCISPARNLPGFAGSFTGVWNWDSAFHAVGVSRWDTALAREALLGFMQFQKDNGLFPDVIFENGKLVDQFSKPPLLGWACEIVYKRDKSIEFLQKVYPMLVKNETYWVKNRMTGGLLHYDSEDKGSKNYEVNVRYESGWDNSVRWDKNIVDMWAIDLNCFMVMNYRALGYMANELSLPEEARMWSDKAEQMSMLINERLWDERNGWYSDANSLTREISDVLSPASFMPLYIGIASKDQACAMAEIAESKFEGKMPTVSFDNPEYSLDYWRGPTWLNVAYFAAKGLKNYDFAVADKIRASVLSMCAKDKEHIYENYDAKAEKGQYCNHFSWSCVFIIEFILNFDKHVFGTSKTDTLSTLSAGID